MTATGPKECPNADDIGAELDLAVQASIGFVGCGFARYETTGSLFSHVDLQERIRTLHPLRRIRSALKDALHSLDAEFDRLHAGEGSSSIAPERLIYNRQAIASQCPERRASLLQILRSIRSGRQALEQMD